jgi:hypothetical protein
MVTKFAFCCGQRPKLADCFKIYCFIRIFREQLQSKQKGPPETRRIAPLPGLVSTANLPRQRAPARAGKAIAGWTAQDSQPQARRVRQAESWPLVSRPATMPLQRRQIDYRPL